ncbi:MAG: YdcF family protein [Coriobacteriales bacterium]|nr:YdcF family protein [Coriobacteriales bacterium]
MRTRRAWPLLLTLSFAFTFALVACAADNTADSAASSVASAPEKSAATDVAPTGNYSGEDASSVSSAVHGMVEEMLLCRGGYGAEAQARVDELLDKISAIDSVMGEKWRSIMQQWDAAESLEVNYGVLPDGLPSDDTLCIVVLGYELNPDGSMQDELLGRLEVARESALKYPEAYVVCTGGGTAKQNPTVSEAGSMAGWLVENGVDASRIMVEDRSITTAQNARYTYQLLRNAHPQVTQLAIVSSDYHLPSGVLVFGAEATLQASRAGEELISVTSNAGYAAPNPITSPLFDAGALIELNGNVQTAFELYSLTYDLNNLPSLE